MMEREGGIAYRIHVPHIVAALAKQTLGPCRGGADPKLTERLRQWWPCFGASQRRRRCAAAADSAAPQFGGTCDWTSVPPLQTAGCTSQVAGMLQPTHVAPRGWRPPRCRRRRVAWRNAWH